MTGNLHFNLCISLFYEKKECHNLIVLAIEPFIRKERLVVNYFFRLSQEMGDHVKLVITTDKSKARMLACKIDAWFKDFFLRKPSLLTVNVTPKQGLFMEFPNNSIHYGVFDTVFIRDPIDVFQLFLKDLSMVLIQIFKRYGQSTPSLMVEITIELFAILCSSARLKNERAVRIFDLLLESEYKKYDSNTLNRILKVNRENYKKNKHQILGYLEELSGQSSNLLTEQWQTSWNLAIKTCSESLKKTIPENNMDDEYIYIINAICDAFDFKERIGAYFLFSSALKEM